MGEYVIEWTAWIAGFAACVALWSSRRANKIAEKNLAYSNASHFVLFREKRLNELRSEMVAFFTAVMGPTLDGTSLVELNRSGTAILLTVDPSDPDYTLLNNSITTEVLRAAHRDLGEDYKPPETTLAHTEDNQQYNPNQLTHLFQRILKREWDNMKLELESFNA